MARVLIVDDDQGLLKILDLAFRKHRDAFEVVFASDGAEAIDILKKNDIDLLVTDIKMPRLDGLALLSHLSVEYPSVPCIILTSYTIPGLEQKLSRSILKFHKKPVQLEELAESIKEGLEQAEKEDALSGISVTGLVQIIEAEQKSSALVLRRQDHEVGSLVFVNGELIDATFGSLRGEGAAVRLLGLDDVQIEFQPASESGERTITSGLQGLLLEAMRIKDEAEVKGSRENIHAHNSALLAESIRLVEGLHLKKAQKQLFKLLQSDPENAEGWLWMSRTLNSKKKLKVALTRMYKLAPKNKAMESEIRKFHVSNDRCGESFIRCPLCFTPLDAGTTQCHFCRSHLAVNDEVFSNIGKQVNQEELKRTLDRFEHVLSRELNIPVLFYAGLASLNLRDFEGALQFFEQLQECVVDQNNVYSKTVQRIVSLIASHDISGEGEKNNDGFQVAPNTPADDGKKKILVVEDSPTTRKVIKMTLDAHGYKTIEAGDGVEALSKLNDERPALILLDVMLPSLDGYGILSLLKKDSEFKKVPVIMLTSKDSFKDKLKGRFSAASAYLTKPFKPEVLLQQVNKHLAKV